MRSASFLVVGLFLSLGCGEPAPTAPGATSPAPPSPSPATTPAVGATATPVAPSPGAPTQAGPTQAPPVAAAPVPSPDVPARAVPTSPPLPPPPSDPARAHVFAVPEGEDEDELPDFGDEDALGEEDLRIRRRLFIPEAARMPGEQDAIPYPMGRDADVQLTIEFPRFRFPDPRLTRLVNERVSAFARARASASAPGVQCTGTATAHLVSIQCSMHRVSQRSSYDLEAAGYAALTLRIEDGEVRPMTVAEAFVPGADVSALLAQGCERYVQREYEDETPIQCAPPPDYAARAAFAAEGLVVGADLNENEWTEPGSFLVPYDELAAHLVARGPLAESLYRRRAQTREIAVDASRALTVPPSRGAWAIGPMASPAELAMRWLRVAPPARDALGIVDGHMVAPSEEVARAIAGSLGLPAREVRVSTAAAPLALRLLTTTRDAPLRRDARRSAPSARVLPRGTIVVGAGDPIDGHTRVLASAEADGYVDARAVGPADPCVPDIGPVLESLPEAARAPAPAVTLRALTRQAGRGRATYATELGSTIHVELRRVGEACAIEAPIVRFDRPGERLTYLGLTHTERGAGDALIVTVASEGEGSQLMVHRYDDGRAVYSAPLGEGQSVAAGRSEGDAWYPVVVLDADGEQVEALVWSGETLARAAAPAP